MTSLSPLVYEVLARNFSPAHQPLVAELLDQHCGANLPLAGSADNIERIRCAVLKLASVQADAVPRHIDMAQCDWRDVLVAAGFGSDVAAHRRWAWQETA